MYSRTENPKENESTEVANSEAQQKNIGRQGLGFVDGRPGSAATKQLAQRAIAHTQAKLTPASNMIQKVSSADYGRGERGAYAKRVKKMAELMRMDNPTLNTILAGVPKADMDIILGWNEEQVSGMDWAAKGFEILKNPTAHVPAPVAPAPVVAGAPAGIAADAAALVASGNFNNDSGFVRAMRGSTATAASPAAQTCHEFSGAQARLDEHKKQTKLALSARYIIGLHRCVVVHEGDTLMHSGLTDGVNVTHTNSLAPHTITTPMAAFKQAYHGYTIRFV